MNSLTYFDIDYAKLSESLSSKTMEKINHVVESIINAEKNISKINESDIDGKAILEYEGMTGTKTRHFYNNICSALNTRYLEIGTWNGSSSISAVYKNNLDGVFIDNWSQFDGDSQIFVNSMEKFKTKESTYKLIEGDCWKVDRSTLGVFNVYLYDGGHEIQEHYDALCHFYDNLADEFIFLVDDFNWLGVREGTYKAIKDLNLDVLFKHEILLKPEDLEGMPNHIGKKTWWNGISIFVLRKHISI